MANNTGWSGGRLFAGLNYTAAFNAGDLNSLANGSSILSGLTPFTNASSTDQLVKVSFKLTISSSTIAAGANIAFWVAYLQLDGTTYGDGRLTAGTAAAYTPPWAPLGVAPIQTGTTIASLVGDIPPAVVDPVSFALIIQNNSGFTLSGSGNSCSLMSFDQGLNF